MNNMDLQLICAVVHQGQGSKVLRVAQEYGINGGTILRGIGCSSRSLLKILGLDTAHREIVLLVGWATTTQLAMNGLKKRFKFAKGEHGLLFCLDLCHVQGIRKSEVIQDSVHEEQEEIKQMSYQAIITIVDLGKGEEVVELAKRAGARGATILHGRGSGIHDTAKLFNMKIEPEKEIVLVIASEQESSPIIETIASGIAIDKPGHGILFSHKLTEVVGLVPKAEN